MPASHKRRRPSHWGLALELSTKLLVNGLLSAAAIAALLKLVPQYQVQREQLRAVRLEVQEAEARVNPLRDHFQRHFVPHNTQAIMEELSPRVNPKQRRIIFLPPSNAVRAASSSE